MPRASRRAVALAATAYILVALVFWWPLPAHLATTTLESPFGDPLLNAWTLAWDADRALHGFRDYWDGLFFYPYADTVAYSEHLLGIAVFTAPLQWLTGNPILVLNVATVASTVLVGVGTFLLTRALTGRADAAFVAGLAMACSPYRLAHTYHLQVLVSGWMPVALYGLHQYLATASRRALALFVVAFALQGLSNGYFLYFTAVPVAVVALEGLWRSRRDFRRVVPGLVVAALVLLAAILPVAVAYMRVRRDQGFTRTLADIALYAATPEAYAHVSTRAWLWGQVLPVGREELQLFPGLGVVLLAVAAVTLVWRRAAPDRRHIALYLGIVVLMVVLSFGPRPVLWGWTVPFSGPYTWLVAVVPGLDGLRVPARMATTVHLGLAVLAGFGLAALTAPAGPQRRRLVTTAAAALVAFEGYGGRQPVQAFPGADMTAATPAYVWLQAQEAGPVLELPVGDAAMATRHLYRTLEHGHRIVNGYSGYGSILQDFVGGPPFTETARIDGALEMLRMLGVRWVVMQPALYEHPAAGAAVAEAIAASRTHVAEVRRFGATVVARLRPGGAEPALDRDPAWRALPSTAFQVTVSHQARDLGRMLDGDPGTRWATATRQGSGEHVTLTFARPTDVAHVRLDLAARSLGDYPRGLVIEGAGDDGTWQTLFDGDILPRLGLSLVREPRSPGIDVPLPPHRSRHLRLRPTGATRSWFWSIHELRVWQR